MSLHANPYNLVLLPDVLVQFLDPLPETPEIPPAGGYNLWGAAQMADFLPRDTQEARPIIQAILDRRPVETYHSHYAPGTVRLRISPKPVAAVEALLRYFAYAHLPTALRERSKPFCDLAISVAHGPQNDETIAALRKLLEAKDCAVRAWL